MTGYLVRRFGQILITLFLIISLAFFLIQAQPGDFTLAYTQNPDIPPEVRAQIQAAFGLDKPLGEQYLLHIKNSFTGNFGVSFGHYPRTVMDVIKERLPRTAVLFLTATVISFYLGFLLGKAMAWRCGGLMEYSATISGATLFTVFTPWFALMMIWIFAFKLGWFPLGKFLDPLLWRDAPVAANDVFIYMLLTSGAFIAFFVMALAISRRVGGRHWRSWLLPAAIVGAAIIPLAWALSGTGYLALDILKHMILPIGTLTLNFLRWNHAANPQQHAGDPARRFCDRRAGQWDSRKTWSGTSTPPATLCFRWLPAWSTAWPLPSTGG